VGKGADLRQYYCNTPIDKFHVRVKAILPLFPSQIGRRGEEAFRNKLNFSVQGACYWREAV
jgi:hypothetical protein